MRVAGLMSGTSLDGVDVAVVDLDERGHQVISFRTFSYSAEIRERLLGISNCNTHTAEISRLNFLLPELYANAVRQCGVSLDTIELVGCHGQTVFHERESTLQIGDGSVLAGLLRIPVVSNFRPADMAAGGRGAPLVPFVDYRLYRDEQLGRVALNVGGIANITAIRSGAHPHDVIAFDTGPGNMVIDQLVGLHNGARYDEGGAIAASATVDDHLLSQLLTHPYFDQPPPKTAGREQYGREFIADLLTTGASLPGLIATATAFTAVSIAEGIRRFVPFVPDQLIVSGGGAHNRTMMNRLAAELPQTALRTSGDFGIDSDAKEAIAFAILAFETWHRRPSNLPSATGAHRPAILGQISFA